MTDKEIVLAKYPEARARQWNEDYAEIRGPKGESLGAGSTIEEAWAHAAKLIKQEPT